MVEREGQTRSPDATGRADEVRLDRLGRVTEPPARRVRATGSLLEVAGLSDRLPRVAHACPHSAAPRTIRTTAYEQATPRWRANDRLTNSVRHLTGANGSFGFAHGVLASLSLVAATLPLATDITPWVARAECRKARPGVFYPPFGESTHARREREAQAKHICAQCPVRAECLDHAVRTNQNLGVWGGLTESERRDLVVEPSHRFPARPTP
jgi:WhiB family redox-sensing transcriptional regulator